MQNADMVRGTGRLLCQLPCRLSYLSYLSYLSGTGVRRQNLHKKYAPRFVLLKK